MYDRANPGRFANALNIFSTLSAVAAVAVMLSACQPTPKEITSGNAATWTNRIQRARLTERQFTRLYAEAVVLRLPGSRVKIAGQRELSVTLPGNRSLTAYLDNVWNECQHTPADRAEICDRYLNALVSAGQRMDAGSGPPPTNSIVPVIKDDHFMADMRKRVDGTNALVAERFVADLWITYAIDDDNQIRFLSEGERQKLGISLADLRALAISNLRNVVKEVSSRGDGPLHMITAGGTYEASLLLSDKLWSGMTNVVQGDFVAAVPSRDVLLFTGSGSPDAIRKIRAMGEEIHKDGSYLISKTLLVRREGRWEKFDQ
jgi:uncharacterized protein YtpQ (UPF0354 family)